MTASTEYLAAQILHHKRLYYQGKSEISDAAYDALEDELRALAPNHPILEMVGYPLGPQMDPSGEAKVRHNIPMLSLAKTYDLKDLHEFVNQHPCMMVEKVDGMALALEYSNGRLVRASTRGDGVYGEDVTEHVFYIPHIPKQLNSTQHPEGDFLTCEVRGEVYFPLSKFVQFEERFESFRNAVPGTLGRKDISDALDVLRELEFFPYDILISKNQIKNLPTEFSLNFKDFSEKKHFLKLLGFHVSSQSWKALPTSCSVDEFKSLVDKAFADERDYRIDGLVFRIRDEELWESLGNTAHHPRGSLAFKQAGETANTEILAIEENVGRSGKITFRAKLKPVSLSGATISYATLHNVEFIELGHYTVGAQVQIIRSGEVIPAILRRLDVHDPETSFTPPTHCPCGYALKREGPDLWCQEKRPCPHKDQESLVYFVQTLGVMGVSDKIVLRLRNGGFIHEPADFFKITIQDLLQIEGFKEKSAKNFVKAFRVIQPIPLGKFLAALGLKRGGIVKCHEVAKLYHTLERVLALDAEELAQNHGWAEKSATDFVQSLEEKMPIIQSLLKVVAIQEETSPLAADATHPYFGKSICITGTLSRPREEYRNILSQIGAKLVDAVTAKTDFLVCNETSSSKKYKEAVARGIPILTEDDFSKNILL